MLLETTTPMRSDADCANAYHSDFSSTEAVCAGDGSTDTCQGDSGGPMMVSDGSFLDSRRPHLVGHRLRRPELPGRLHPPRRPDDQQVGARPGADGPRQRLEHVATAQPGRDLHRQHPERGAASGDLHGPRVELRRRHATAHGASPSHAYAAAGTYIARLTASTTGADIAVAKVRVDVASPPPPPPPVVAPARSRPSRPSSPSARILASGRPLVTHGRFHIRVNFTADAPDGHGDHRGVPRQEEDRDRQDRRAPQRLEARDREVVQGRPEAAAPKQEQEAQGNCEGEGEAAGAADPHTHHPPLIRRLLLPLAAAAAFLAPTPASAVVNGSPAEQGEFPAQGVLRADTDENPGFDRFCGGTLIGSRQFVTAANCVTDPFGEEVSPAKLLVRLGDIDRAPAEPDDYLVTSYVKAPPTPTRRRRTTPPSSRSPASRTTSRCAWSTPPRPASRARASSPPSWAGAGSAPRRTSRRTSARSTSRSPTTAAAPPPTAPRYKPGVMMCAADPLGTSPSTARRLLRGRRGRPAARPRRQLHAARWPASPPGTTRRRAPTRAPGRLHAADRRRAQPLDPQQDAGGRLRPQPPAARRRARDADLDLAPPRRRRLLHDLPVGPRQRRLLRRRQRPLDLARLPHRGPAVAGLEASSPAATRRRSTTVRRRARPPGTTTRRRAHRRAAHARPAGSPRSSPPSARR